MFYKDRSEEENSNDRIEDMLNSVNRMAEFFNIKPIPDKDHLMGLIGNFTHLLILEDKVGKILYYLNACGEESISIKVLQSVLYIAFPKGIKNKTLKSKLIYHNFLDEDHDYINIFPLTKNFDLLSDIIFSTEGIKEK